MENEYYINRFISVIYRQAQRYYDRQFDPQIIRRGQYFFLTRISEHEGISVLELAKNGYFDKGTTAKAIKKLEELSYVRVVPDQNDRRVHRLYTTKQATQVLSTIQKARQDWEDALTKNLSKEEISTAKILLKKLAENAFETINRMEMNENGPNTAIETDEPARD